MRSTSRLLRWSSHTRKGRVWSQSVVGVAALLLSHGCACGEDPNVPLVRVAGSVACSPDDDPERYYTVTWRMSSIVGGELTSSRDVFPADRINNPSELAAYIEAEERLDPTATTTSMLVEVNGPFPGQAEATIPAEDFPDCEIEGPATTAPTTTAPTCDVDGKLVNDPDRDSGVRYTADPAGTGPGRYHIEAVGLGWHEPTGTTAWDIRVLGAGVGLECEATARIVNVQPYVPVPSTPPRSADPYIKPTEQGWRGQDPPIKRTTDTVVRAQAPTVAAPSCGTSEEEPDVWGSVTPATTTGVDYDVSIDEDHVYSVTATAKKGYELAGPSSSTGPLPTLSCVLLDWTYVESRDPSCAEDGQVWLPGVDDGFDKRQGITFAETLSSDGSSATVTATPDDGYAFTTDSASPTKEYPLVTPPEDCAPPEEPEE